MCNAELHLVDGNIVKIGDTFPVGLLKNNEIEHELTADGRVLYCQVPLETLDYIVFNGEKYKDIHELMQIKADEFSEETLFSCGEGENMQWVKAQDINIEVCPFGVSSDEECDYMCHSVVCYRGDNFDLAQPVYGHGLECIVIGIKGEIYNQD